MKNFKTTAHAKCILAGEHAVIYGCPALVLPVKKLTMTLKFKDSKKGLKVIGGSSQEEIAFKKTWNESLRLLHKTADTIQGEFTLKSTIPLGSGLGFSAALCVVIARWLIWKKWLKENRLFQFARLLEDSHHGKSSGVDIAGVISNHSIHYELCSKPNIQEMKWRWHPKLYLSYSGTPKQTKKIVKTLRKLKSSKPEVARLIDREMENSVYMVEEALKMDQKSGLRILAWALQEAHRCFEEWGLIIPALRKHMDKLRKCGALAVKPTGAGAGGMCLAYGRGNRVRSLNSWRFEGVAWM